MTDRTERCWEELRRAGKALAKGEGDPSEIINAVASYFELPSSPETEAVHVFLDGLCSIPEDDELFAADPLPEAAQ
jgi:hypothetical protein